MSETVISVTGLCSVVLTEWDGQPASVCIEYVERQNDRWYSDSTTQADIDAKTAGQIVNLLLRAFPQLRNTPTPHPTDTEEEK